MTIKKQLLTLSIILSCGLIAVGIACAQTPSPQEPLTRVEPREFSILINGGSFLGVYAEDISKENMGRYGLRDIRGVGVTEVVKDSPAEKAGLRKGDVITRFDNEAVTSVRKLNRLVSEVAPDHKVSLGISRGGSE